MRIQTRTLGAVEATPESFITLPEGLLGYETLGSDALLSIPTPEHYLPLLYVLALQRDGDEVRFFNEQVVSSISMRSVQIGATA